MNALPRWTVERLQKADLPMVKFCVQVALYQIKKGRYFMIENPQTFETWKLADILSLLNQAGVTWNTLDMCAFGMVDPFFPGYRCISL